MALGNTFVVPWSWAEDFPKLAEWAGANAYWKVVHTAGFEPFITLEARVRMERVEFSRARFLELVARFRIDVPIEVSSDFWQLVQANGRVTRWLGLCQMSPSGWMLTKPQQRRLWSE